jgi:hypothetical protein
MERVTRSACSWRESSPYHQSDSGPAEATGAIHASHALPRTVGGAMKLTVKTTDGIKLPTGKSDCIVFDDDIAGFGLRLREGGSRTWVYQYRIGKKQRRMVLGSAKSVPLINEGRDSNAAYEVPLADERPLTTDDQLSGQYRLVAKLLDAEDARRRQRQRS